MKQKRTDNAAFACEFIDEHEAAAILNVAVGSLRNQRWRGEGVPFVKIGRTVRYSRAAINNFVASNTFRSTTEAEIARSARGS